MRYTQEQYNFLVEEYDKCYKLWEAVLRQALRDLDAKQSRERNVRNHACLDMFSESNAGFVNICKVLGVEPSKIVKRVRESHGN